MDGRLQQCGMKADNGIFHVINLYAPNGGVERKQFFDTVYNKMHSDRNINNRESISLIIIFFLVI